MKLHARQFFEKEIWLRDDASDDALFNELVDKDEYGYIRFLKEPRVIIDAGANIGLSTRLFANRFPKAKIIAIEPEAENYKLLKLNTEEFPNIIPVHAALMDYDGNGNVIDVGEGDLAYQVKAEQNGIQSVKCISFKTMCEKYEIEEVNLLKIDIEGTEYDLFERNQIDLKSTDVLIIELHDRLRPGCNEVFFQSVRDCFDLEWIGGENYYFAKAGAAQPIIPEAFKKSNPQRLPIEDVWRLERDISEKVGQVEILSVRVDALEGLYRRVDTLEEIYSRVDALEGLYPRIDQLETLPERLDRLEIYVHRLEQKVSIMREKISSLDDQLNHMNLLTVIKQSIRYWRKLL